MGFKTLLGCGSRPVVSSGGSTMLWSGTNKTTNMVISGANLIATASGSGDNHVRAQVSYTGKGFFAMTPTVVGTAASLTLALANSSYPITDDTVGVFGTNIFSMDGGGNLDGGTSGFEGSLNFTSGTAMHVAFDTTAKIWWIKKGAGGTWNGDPVAGTGGHAFTTTGALFPVGIIGATANGSSWTIDTSATPPSGFSWAA